MKFLMVLLLFFSTKTYAEGKFGANYLGYTENGIKSDRSYNLWISINEPFVANERLGIGLFTQYENFPGNENMYAELKPYYELFKDRFKIDVRVVQVGLKDKATKEFEKKIKVGLGLEYKIWQ
jgi:hypothetical protein